VAVRTGDELDDAAMSLNRAAERLDADDTALRASRARLASIADGERRRMERDLRRRVLVRLQRISEEVGEVEAQLTDIPDLHRLCSRVQGSVAEAEAEINRLARGVYPAELTELGLEVALAAAADRMAVPTTLTSPGVGRLEGAQESAVYFCCNEALQNAAKHAGDSATATVTLARENGRLLFEVVDDGHGFAVNGSGRGLANMRDRIRAVGGDLMVVSNPGIGTRIAGWVPTAG
jgi:signal transduction histidine kinase